jgi:hypothetical protein
MAPHKSGLILLSSLPKSFSVFLGLPKVPYVLMHVVDLILVEMVT